MLPDSEGLVSGLGLFELWKVWNGWIIRAWKNKVRLGEVLSCLFVRILVETMFEVVAIRGPLRRRCHVHNIAVLHDRELAT